METKKAIYQRRSIRKFKNKKISEKTLCNIIDAGIQGPATCNQQLYYFILINDKTKRIMKEKAGFKFARESPTLLAICFDRRYNSENYANIQTIGAVVENMALYAHSIGIGALWMCGFGDKTHIKEILKIPPHHEVASFLALGYADESPLRPKKRSPKEILFYNECPFKEQKNVPDEWKLKDIFGLADRSIYAKSPEIGYFHLFSLQLQKEIEFMNKHLGKENISFYEASGLYFFPLAQRNQDKKFTIVVVSEDTKRWMEKRASYLKIKNCTFTTKIPKSKFDTVLFLDLMNRFPKKDLINLLKTTKSMMKQNSKLLANFSNKFSLYGALFRNGVARRYGPEISLSPKEVELISTKASLKIQKRTGFNLIPSPKIFFKIGVPEKYQTLNKYLRFSARYNLLEGSKHNFFLKNLCTSNIIVATKQNI